VAKILSQAGISLADVYDIEGSIAGTDELLSKEVNLTHEMGGQIFSERLQSFLIKAQSGDILQSVVFAMNIASFPPTTNRLLGVSALVDTSGRLANLCVSIRDEVDFREYPIWNWDFNNDNEQVFRWSDDGAGVAEFFLLNTPTYRLPEMLIQEGTPKIMPSIQIRGTTNAFGAGTLETFVLIHVARPEGAQPAAGEPSSFGLPLPSW